MYAVNKAGKTAFESAKSAGVQCFALLYTKGIIHSRTTPGSVWCQQHSQLLFLFQQSAAVRLALAKADPFSDCRVSPLEMMRLRNEGALTQLRFILVAIVSYDCKWPPFE